MNDRETRVDKRKKSVGPIMKAIGIVGDMISNVTSLVHVVRGVFQGQKTPSRGRMNGMGREADAMVIAETRKQLLTSTWGQKLKKKRSGFAREGQSKGVRLITKKKG